MAPDRFASDETGSALEKILLEDNGDRVTLKQLKEYIVASSHDSRARDGLILAKLDAHAEEMLHMTPGGFSEFMDGRDAIITEIRADMDAIKANCLEVHTRSPRRRTDPETEEWGQSVFGGKEDEEMGDLRRAWRVLKWVVVVIGGTMMVVVGEKLASMIFGLG